MAIMLAGGVPPKFAGIMIDRLGLYICSDVYEDSLYLSRQRDSGKELGELHGGVLRPGRGFFPQPAR